MQLVFDALHNTDVHPHIILQERVLCPLCVATPSFPSVSQVTGLAWAEFMLAKQIFATVEKERERTRVEWAGRARRDTEPAK